MAATLYRYGPAHRDAAGNGSRQVRYSVRLVGCSDTAFKAYAANFGRFDVTYGSLSAAIVFLTWSYLSSYVLLFGAELNSELDKISSDTGRTRYGPERTLDPMGRHRPGSVGQFGVVNCRAHPEGSDRSVCRYQI